jgi:hypothetical protein
VWPVADVSRRYKLAYEACDVMQAVYNKERCSNKALLSAKPLMECLSSFHSAVDEVMMTASKDALGWKSFAPGTGGDGNMQTETSFNPRELDRYTVRGSTSVTFAIRELKSIVEMCDKVHCGIAFSFDGPGSPIIFSAENMEEDLQLDLVLATLQGADGFQDQSQLDESVPPSQQPPGPTQPERSMRDGNVHLT